LENQTLEIRLQDLAHNWKRCPIEIKPELDSLAYELIDNLCDTREERKMYRDKYYKWKVI